MIDRPSVVADWTTRGDRRSDLEREGYCER
jgi:hypothetical protein